EISHHGGHLPLGSGSGGRRTDLVPRYPQRPYRGPASRVELAPPFPRLHLAVVEAKELQAPFASDEAEDAGLLRTQPRPCAFSGDRATAKPAVLGAVYGQASGDGLKTLAALRRRLPTAVAYVDEAARAGEEGRLVSTWLGRACPPAARTTDDSVEEAGIPL